MRKLLFLLVGIAFLSRTGLTQQVMVLPLSIQPFIPEIPASLYYGQFNVPETTDSTSLLIDLPVNMEIKKNSVFDVYWVTNCIIGGWNKTDTLLIGNGLEECDTAYPFIMPVVGKFFRGFSGYHDGWDIGLNLGDPVKAGLGGVVRFAGYSHGYGKLVIVRHFSGVEVFYAHLSKIKVHANEYVEAGDTIGLGGATGDARGNHLHLEFRLCDRPFDISRLYTQNDTVINLYKIKEIASEQNKPQTAAYHKVVRGETLSGIANRYGTTVTKLCSLNGISKTSILRIGQRVRVK